MTQMKWFFFYFLLLLTTACIWACLKSFIDSINHSDKEVKPDFSAETLSSSLFFYSFPKPSPCLCSTCPSSLNSDLGAPTSENHKYTLCISSEQPSCKPSTQKKSSPWSEDITWPGHHYGSDLPSYSEAFLGTGWSLQSSKHWPGHGKSSSLILGSRAKKGTHRWEKKRGESRRRNMEVMKRYWNC